MLSDNLVSYWKLDESSWNASDSVGSNTLTNTNVTYATWKINNWGSFNWSSSYFTSSWSVVSWTWPVSMFAWVNITSIKDSNTIISKRDNNNSWLFFWKIYSNWKQQFQDYNGSLFQFPNTPSNTVMSAWTWYHVWFIRNWTSWTFYLNWVSDWTITASSNLSWNTQSLKIGIDSVDWSWSCFNGKIDEVWVRNKVLSSTEITQLYNSWAWLQYPFTTETSPSFLMMF